MSSKKLKVLVTGGAGYIGSHTTHQLLEAGHRVTVVDNLYSGHRWAVPADAEFVEADAGDRSEMLALMSDASFDAVIHFAGHIVVPESVENPDKYYRNNVLGSLNLIDSATACGIGMFIFSSSAAVYGNPAHIPVSETAPLSPINPYGRTKLITEWTLQDMAQRDLQPNPLRYVALRYFNVAGAHLDGRLGQATPEATHLIKVACETACGKRDLVSIFGTDYDTPDGTCIRDYVHVCDLVDAHVLGLKWLKDGKGSEVFNLGTGSGFSVREVITHSRSVTNRDVPIVEGPRRAGDCTKLVSGSFRAERDLGWTPTRSKLEVMIADAWRWHQTGHYDK